MLKLPPLTQHKQPSPIKNNKHTNNKDLCRDANSLLECLTLTHDRPDASQLVRLIGVGVVDASVSRNTTNGQ